MSQRWQRFSAGPFVDPTGTGSILSPLPWLGTLSTKDIVKMTELQEDRPMITITLGAGCTVAAMEKALIQLTLCHCKGNKTETAALLGISLKTLYNRLNTYKNRD